MSQKKQFTNDFDSYPFKKVYEENKFKYLLPELNNEMNQSTRNKKELEK